MATIKYKHNNEWRDLNIPLTLLTQGGGGSEGEDTGALESVVITGTKNLAAFPKLSAYIDDLSQIEFMCWMDVKKNDTYYDIHYYTYAPSYSENLFAHYVTILSNGGTYTVGSDNNTYKLTGTPSNVKMLINDYETSINFVNKIYMSYKGE